MSARSRARQLAGELRRLNDEEFADVQRHAEEGWGILYGLEALDDVLVGVLHHHERWDAGAIRWPAGRHDPLDARILAVADAYDAMTVTPVPQGTAHEQTEEILRQGAGTQWTRRSSTCSADHAGNVEDTGQLRAAPAPRATRLRHAARPRLEPSEMAGNARVRREAGGDRPEAEAEASGLSSATDAPAFDVLNVRCSAANRADGHHLNDATPSSRSSLQPPAHASRKQPAQVEQHRNQPATSRR